MAAQIFGLDIGRSYVKVVHVKVNGEKKMLMAAATVPVAVDAMKSEAPEDLKKVSAAIENCVKSAKVSGGQCVVSIIESQAVTRLIEMPNLTDKELSAAISWEADQYIPLPLKDVNLHYIVVSKPESASGAGKMQVLLVAAPKRVIKKYTDIVRSANLTIVALETESSALARALTKKLDPETLIVSLGGSSTEIILARGGNVLFSRSLASGGQTLTKAVMSEFNLSSSQAEQYKIAYGLLEDKLSGKIAAVLRPILDILAGEILKAADFARTHVENLQVSRMIICGGGAYLLGLPQYLAEKTSIEVSVADPWQDFIKEGLVLKMPGQGSFYCTATGLALCRS